ncbi:MAG: hypothetical protein GY906_09685 [bacterium]|nr:hypothetical protein [bacterium]
MAVSFLASLTLRARTAFPFIRRGIREGLSANRIQSALQKSGLGLRRTNLLAIVRRERFIQNFVSALDRLAPNRHVPTNMLPEALTRMTRSLSFTVEVRGYLTDTGARTSQFVTLSMDETMTPQEMIDLAVEIVEDEPSRYGMVVDDGRLTEGLRSGPLGTL